MCKCDHVLISVNLFCIAFSICKSLLREANLLYSFIVGAQNNKDELCSSIAQTKYIKKSANCSDIF